MSYPSRNAPRAAAAALLSAVAITATATAAAAAAHAEQAPAEHGRHLLQVPDAVTRSIAYYVSPPIEMVRADGKRVVLARELDDGRPVVLDFIYTSCTSICPLSSQTFAALQERLGPERDRVHLVSISIDPEEDTPARLTKYSQHVNAGPQWQFYTGTVTASLAVQNAFGAYSGDKMSHTPLTLVRVAPGKPWVRLAGFATVGDLINELHGSVAAR
jgi:protein SCO1/2